MFLANKMISCLLLCLLLTIRVSPLPFNEEEGIVESDNPNIEGEDEEIEDPELMFNEGLEDGDIELTETQKREFQNAPLMRTGEAARKYRWPKTIRGRYVIIPYIIGNAPGYTDTQLAIIREAMNDIEKATCVRFRKREKQNDYIRIYSGKGCHSPLGRVGGLQNVSLNRKGCIRRKIVAHELIHAIGFRHMHQRFDRDKHLTIMWQNIKEDKKFSFKKVDNQWEAYNTKYDFYSVMHYRKTGAFSKNGKNLIFTKDPYYLDIIGNSTTLSKGDARRINLMYKCP